MIAKMAWISRKHGVVLSRVSLSDLDVQDCDGDLRDVRRAAKVIDQAVEDGCIRFRYPRPAVTVSPRRSLLLLT
jgi:diaminopimelate decarboxylase